MVGAVGRSASRSDATIAAKWRTNLHNVIGGELLGYVYKRAYEAQLPGPKSLWFTDNNTVVATFVIREPEAKPTLQSRNDADRPIRLRAILLDAATGNVTANASWPSESSNALIVTTEEGKIVTQTGDELNLYDSKLQKLKGERLPTAPITGWHAIPSPSGRSILLETIDPPTMPNPARTERLTAWRWVETDTLETLQSWNRQPSSLLSISDDKLVFSRLCSYLGCERLPRTLEIGQRSSKDWTILGSGNGWGDSQPYFVDDDAFFLYPLGPPLSGRSTAKLVRTNGEVLFAENEPFENGIWWTHPVASSQGNRFVAEGVQEKGGSALLDISADVLLRKLFVYDLAPLGNSQVLDVKGPTIKNAMQLILALSPDGSHLAILSDETVQVFDLPPLKK